jgi:hypothetical protein
VREKERRRPYYSGDVANRNGVSSHEPDLKQISLRVLGFYPLSDKKDTKITSKVHEK